MKLRTLFILALAGACLCAPARSRKKKQQTLKIEKMQPVPADTFSYAMGVAQSESLKQYLLRNEGVDSAYIGEVVKALQEYDALTGADVKRKAAYAAGLRIAEMNKKALPSINKQFAGDSVYMSLPQFTKGLTEGMTGKGAVSADSAMNIVKRQQEFRLQQLKGENEVYLINNAKLKDVRKTASGLQYKVIKQGTGAVASDTTEVEVHYEGKLIDGTVFDSSYKRGKPATFRPNQVIKGWTEALKMMPEGSVYELYIPYELG